VDRFESGQAPPARVERAARCLTGLPPSLIEGSVLLRAPVSAQDSSQPDCSRPYHHESAQKVPAVALDGMRDQSSFGARGPSRQANEDNADRAMMLSEDKFSEVLVVGNENLPGLGCSLQYRGVWTTARQLGGVHCDVAE
jgi:hypothetical protein